LRRHLKRDAEIQNVLAWCLKELMEKYKELEQQLLVFTGEQLEDDRTLLDYNIKNNQHSIFFPDFEVVLYHTYFRRDLHQKHDYLGPRAK